MCDTLVALGSATEQGITLFAKNSDRPPDERQMLCWSPSRLEKGSLTVTHIEVAAHGRATYGCLLSIPDWGWGAEHGVNEAGVAIGNEAIYTTLDPRTVAPALTGMDLVRLGLERASCADDAVQVIIDLLDRYGQGGTGHDPAGVQGAKSYWSSFLIADPITAFVLETSGRRWALERVVEARAISNRTTIAEFDSAVRHPRQPVADLVDPRWFASQRVLANRPVTRAALVDHLRSHDSAAVPGWSVCMHAADGEGNLIEVTTSSIVAELPRAQTPRAWVLTGHPCANEYIEVPVTDEASAVLSAAGR